MSITVISFRIWFFTVIIFTMIWAAGMAWINPSAIGSALIAMIAAFIGSIPVLIIFFVRLPSIGRKNDSLSRKIQRVHGLNFYCTAAYGIAGACIYSLVDSRAELLKNMGVFTLVLFTCATIATLLSYKKLTGYFRDHAADISHHQTLNMETFNESATSYPGENSQGSNPILIKGLITAGLILAMLIPTLFIGNLVQEREARQREVTHEVSSKWADSQVLAGPFIYLPYDILKKDDNGKPVHEKKAFWVLPENLQVTGKIDHELRRRSIYNVLLFRASLAQSGNIIFRIPETVDSSAIDWKEARIGYMLSDFKGIEEKIIVQFNGTDLELNPETSVAGNWWKGLSAPITLSPADIGKSFPFHFNTKIKGSEKLDFLPLAGNSRFDLQSSWPSPSFDGNALPSVRSVSDSGFAASWIFNKANLPFGTVLNDIKLDEAALAFGVTLVQPADGYSKTNRCIKYAILFIGLTFSIFFIVELMQKKPLHPVQYVLIGLALVIFYTLLLSVSEFVLFDYAYAIAAVATILLISLYSKSHFQSWKSAAIFGTSLTALYGFIFVLIQLEDTALLIGSIGLFAILAVIMFVSRKINWYGSSRHSMALES